MSVSPNGSPAGKPRALPRVLVVDDEPSVRMVARLMLERSGYAVEEAGTGADAVARAQAAVRPFW